MRSVLLSGADKHVELVKAERAAVAASLDEEPFDDRSDASKLTMKTHVAATVHNMYNGLEAIMRIVCKNVDDHEPKGESSHQAILEQMSSPSMSRRTVLVPNLVLEDMQKLKGFRHVFNHGYAMTLRTEEAFEALDGMDRVLPVFLSRLDDLDKELVSNDVSFPEP